ncbi:hypothetical protein V4V34_07205 [Lysinibacillus sphaericus]|uniref:hypothetical protein n=1 Tax=Lysinibacillus sphaericus TaxID=1421 RepID=UPI002FBED694
MDANYLPAIITASIALIAAISAQFLNNELTNNREERKYYRDIYGNLIADKLNLFIEYAYMFRNPMSDEELEEKNIERIINKFESDIQYFNPRLQLNYSYYKINGYIEGSSEELKKRLEFELAFHFIMYAKQVIKKAKINTDRNYDVLLQNVASTFAYLAIGTNFKGFELTKNNLIGLNRAFNNTLNDYTLEYYEDILINHYNYPAESLVNKVDNIIREIY